MMLHLTLSKSFVVCLFEVKRGGGIFRITAPERVHMLCTSSFKAIGRHARALACDDICNELISLNTHRNSPPSNRRLHLATILS